MPRDGDVVYEPSLFKPKSDVMQLLEEGQRRIQRNWLQGASIKKVVGGYAYCMVGAVWFDDRNGLMRSDDSIASDAHFVLLQAVKLLTRSSRKTVAVYNDHWQRTWCDAIQAYDVAIELQDRREQGLPI
jgi:hypothetical protein